jgi:hypothetical protein
VLKFFLLASGGLRCAPTTGYYLTALRAETICLLSSCGKEMFGCRVFRRMPKPLHRGCED